MTPQEKTMTPQGRITHRVETVTPEIATSWLERNEINRNVVQSTVDRYARDMRAGRWHMTGDPIQFGASGRLLNGQHRLWACVEADVPFETLVVRGIVNEVEVMDVIDTGTKRTLASALQIHGEKDGNVLAAIITMCWRYERRTSGGGLTKTYPTHEEGLRWLEEHPDARAAVLVARKASRDLRIPSTSAGVAFYLNSRVDAEAAEEFWTLACSGEGLPAGSPILAYRRWIIGSLAKRDKPTPEVWLAYNLKAMNLWRAGKRTALLAVKHDEIPSTWK